MWGKFGQHDSKLCHNKWHVIINVEKYFKILIFVLSVKEKCTKGKSKKIYINFCVSDYLGFVPLDSWCLCFLRRQRIIIKSWSVANTCHCIFGWSANLFEGLFLQWTICLWKNSINSALSGTVAGGPAPRKEWDDAFKPPWLRYHLSPLDEFASLLAVHSFQADTSRAVSCWWPWCAT